MFYRHEGTVLRGESLSITVPTKLVPALELSRIVYQKNVICQYFQNGNNIFYSSQKRIMLSGLEINLLDYIDLNKADYFQVYNTNIIKQHLCVKIGEYIGAHHT